MLVTWLIDHLVCDIYVGLPNGPVFYVITLDQHVIHKRTRVINVRSQLSRSLEPTTTSDQGDVGFKSRSGQLQFCPEVVQC